MSRLAELGVLLALQGVYRLTRGVPSGFEGQCRSGSIVLRAILCPGVVWRDAKPVAPAKGRGENHIGIASRDRVMATTGVPAFFQSNKDNGRHQGLIMVRPVERSGGQLEVGDARGIPVHAGRFECAPAVEDESDERYA